MELLHMQFLHLQNGVQGSGVGRGGPIPIVKQKLFLYHCAKMKKDSFESCMGNIYTGYTLMLFHT